MSSRTQAAEAYIKALRTGEPSATQSASQYLADDVVLATAQGEVSGRAEVLKRITGQWPLTPVFQHAGFGSPQESDGTIKYEADFPPMGAAPQKLNVEVHNSAGMVIARGENLSRTADTPMIRLRRQGDKITREDIWPTESDFGTRVIVAGGEVGTLQKWWNDAEQQQWRWSLEFYNHR